VAAKPVAVVAAKKLALPAFSGRRVLSVNHADQTSKGCATSKNYWSDPPDGSDAMVVLGVRPGDGTGGGTASTS
jgi:hypothetical protein